MPAASYPSLYSSVLSVAARPDSDSAGFAYNAKPPVEFGAAGIDVEVARMDKSVITATGNSFAAPVIAGYATRILGKHPGLTPFQVKTILHATADNVREMQGLPRRRSRQVPGYDIDSSRSPSDWMSSVFAE